MTQLPMSAVTKLESASFAVVRGAPKELAYGTLWLAAKKAIDDGVDGLEVLALARRPFATPEGPEWATIASAKARSFARWPAALVVHAWQAGLVVATKDAGAMRITRAKLAAALKRQSLATVQHYAFERLVLGEQPELDEAWAAGEMSAWRGLLAEKQGRPMMAKLFGR